MEEPQRTDILALWEHRQHAVAFNALLTVWLHVNTAPRLAIVLQRSPAAMHCQLGSDGQCRQQAFQRALFSTLQQAFL